MREALWARLRDWRYALPGWVGRHAPGPDAAAAERLCRRAQLAGMMVTPGYFHGPQDTPDSMAAAHCAMAARLAGCAGAYLSVKGPAMGHDPAMLVQVAQAAARAGLSVLLDAHGPGQADATIAALPVLAEHVGDAGLALPARWPRSLRDAAALRDTPARLRIVMGEWPDPDCDTPGEAAYLALV
ncbi:MAG TPA: proline dehydrogenase, partial [Novosphingobium sp.]|nr:proline dehydrogenase [Novosphingobium sp.]